MRDPSENTRFENVVMTWVEKFGFDFVCLGQITLDEPGPIIHIPVEVEPELECHDLTVVIDIQEMEVELAKIAKECQGQTTLDIQRFFWT